MKKDYKQPVMVNWYQPKMLLNIGLKAIISGTFGNYADRRELEAALNDNVNKEEWNKLEQEYCTNKNDIWVDVVNDTGDGFASTFAIAKSVAANSLPFEYLDEKGQTQKIITQRGKILVFGGDEVYPFPSQEEYTNRFIIPFSSACDDHEALNKKEDRPHLYAIPGNHDWYDGLGNFIKLFCQQRTIGIWNTMQHRSYFALPLPNRYWIWATDIQLNSDIDKPQLCYFEAIAEKMKDGDKVILITAEPAWVYNRIHNKDLSFERLQFFVDRYIYDKENLRQEKINKQEKHFRLAATLTGDLHHYSRYCRRNNQNGHQYITAGGGGAFLHLTHNLPKSLNSLRDPRDSIYREKIFPDARLSLKLLFNNFIFPFKNFFFTFLLWCVYLLFFWIIQVREPRDQYLLYSTSPSSFYETITLIFNHVKIALFDNTGVTFKSFFNYVAYSIFRNPAIAVMTLALGGGFYAFTDVKVLKWIQARIIGILHALGQVAILFLFMYFLKNTLFGGLLHSFASWEKLLFAISVCFTGSIIAGLYMGVYLYLSNRLLNMHIDEASSSFASPHYKNFIRLHVHDRGITIYPIGIRRVPKKWKQKYNVQEDTYSFTGNKVETFLIEKPVSILDEKLT